MEHYFKTFGECILNIGIKQRFSHIQKHQIRNANLGGIVAFIFTCICTVATSFYIPPPYIYVPFIGALGYLLTLVFNHYGFYGIAYKVNWVVSLILFFWMAGAYGESSNAYLLFIIAEMMAILNFEQEKKWILITTILPVMLAGITYYTHFSLFLIPALKETQLEDIHPIFFFSVLVGAAVIVWTHRIQVQSKIQLLEEKYEEVEKANAELQKTNEELDRFVYSVSHDLRAPITSVMGLVDLCSSDKENIDMYLALQRKSMNKLDNFIKDILNYARNSRLEVLHVALDLPTMIQETFENQAYAHAAENIKLAIEVNGTNTLYADAFRLNVVLANIISNAIRYRNQNANPSYIHFQVDLQREIVKITVSDNGVGISTQHLPHIFQMFYRANARVSGSGLGLYIVKEALNKMKGQIEVQSEEGKGTIFVITMPNLQN